MNQNLDICVQEIRSLFGRIEVRCKGLNYIEVTRSYSEMTPNELPFLDMYNHSRSACISKMAANHPWATVVDLEIILEGWDMGEKWFSHKNNLEFCTSQLVANNPVRSQNDYIPPVVTVNTPD